MCVLFIPPYLFQNTFFRQKNRNMTKKQEQIPIDLMNFFANISFCLLSFIRQGKHLWIRRATLVSWSFFQSIPEPPLVEIRKIFQPSRSISDFQSIPDSTVSSKNHLKTLTLKELPLANQKWAFYSSVNKNKSNETFLQKNHEF